MAQHPLEYDIFLVTPDGDQDFRVVEPFPGFYAYEASLWSCVKSTFCV